MCSRTECLNRVGQYVRFQTQYGYHEGLIEKVSGNKVIILSPRPYVPAKLLSGELPKDEEQRLNVALAWGGYGAPGAGAYGAAPGYGGAYGPGYGYGWGGGWAWWAIPFLAIFALWGLFFW